MAYSFCLPSWYGLGTFVSGVPLSSAALFFGAERRSLISLSLHQVGIGWDACVWGLLRLVVLVMVYLCIVCWPSCVTCVWSERACALRVYYYFISRM